MEDPLQDTAAALVRAVEVVKFLAPLANNLNVTNNIGWNAIHYAALNGKIEVVKFLAPLIDEPNIRDNTGKIPIDLAKINGHNEVVEFLESYKKSAKRATLN